MMARQFSSKLIFVFCISSSRLFAQVQAQWCYDPGTEARNLQQYPCDAYAYTTLCCPLGWTCFSNNLCVVTDEAAVGNALPIGTASRGTCTNPSWNETACGNFCLDETGSSNNGSLQDCGNGNWCCQSSVDSGNCDCQSGEGTFPIPDGEAQTIIGITGLASTSTNSPISSKSSSVLPSSTIKSTSSSSRTSSTVKSTATSSNLQITSSHTSTLSQTSHASSSAASLASATSTHAPISVTQKPGFKAGIAVAVILVVLAIAAFCLWFFWYRHRDRSNPNLGAMSEADSDIYHPEPSSAVPGPVLRPSPDPYEFRPSPVSAGGGNRNSGMWSGGYSGGFAGRATDERIRPVPDPYLMPYEGT